MGSPWSAPTFEYVCLCASMLMCSSIGTANFYLQDAITATSFQLGNCLLKQLAVLLSRITNPVPIPVVAWVGYSVSFVGVMMYTFDQQLHEMYIRWYLGFDNV